MVLRRESFHRSCLNKSLYVELLRLSRIESSLSLLELGSGRDFRYKEMYGRFTDKVVYTDLNASDKVLALDLEGDLNVIRNFEGNVIVGIECLQYLRNPERFLKRLGSLMRSDQKFVFTVPNSVGYHGEMYRVSKNLLISWITNAGFNVEIEYEFGNAKTLLLDAVLRLKIEDFFYYLKRLGSSNITSGSIYVISLK